MLAASFLFDLSLKVRGVSGKMAKQARSDWREIRGVSKTAVIKNAGGRPSSRAVKGRSSHQDIGPVSARDTKYLRLSSQEWERAGSTSGAQRTAHLHFRLGRREDCGEIFIERLYQHDLHRIHVAARRATRTKGVLSVCAQSVRIPHRASSCANAGSLTKKTCK
jgi:hypothetical protein